MYSLETACKESYTSRRKAWSGAVLVLDRLALSSNANMQLTDFFAHSRAQVNIFPVIRSRWCYRPTICPPIGWFDLDCNPCSIIHTQVWAGTAYCRLASRWTAQGESGKKGLRRIQLERYDPPTVPSFGMRETAYSISGLDAVLA